MRSDVVEALKHIKIPVLRWPGGCFADEYHWMDGIGAKRRKIVNTHWGGVTEDNSFGTHEFMELCRQLECEPYINGNLGSGTVREMSEWVEYLTSEASPMAELRAENGRAEPWRVKYFGIGNENWGCGGNMRPEYYADEYRRFQTYLRNYGDNKLFKIACGSPGRDYNWTEKVMEIAGRYMDAITLHHYSVPTGDWKQKGSATGFDVWEYYSTMQKCLKMDELITNHLQIMHKYDPAHKVGLVVDEWGTWYDVEPGTNPGFLYQQNTMRDALVAAATLNIFNKHSGRVVMANLAQTVNVLQAVILTEGRDMLLTPTYHVFDLFKEHQDATLVDCFIETEAVGVDDISVPNLSVSASVNNDGELHITLANLSIVKAYDIQCETAGMHTGSVSGRLLTGKADAHNTFEQPDSVRPVDFSRMEYRDGTLNFSVPANSVVQVTVQPEWRII
jgi:alpha-N-arabinofuranosidase